jgi:hypothetical protein
MGCGDREGNKVKVKYLVITVDNLMIAVLMNNTITLQSK